MIRKKHLKESIAIKMISQLFIATLLIIFISLLISRRMSKGILAERLKADAFFISYSLGSTLSPLLNRNEMMAVQRIVENVGSTSFIKKILILDTKYTIKASNNLFEVNTKIAQKSAMDIFEKGKLQSIIYTDTEYSIAIPIKGEKYIEKNTNDTNWVLLIYLEVGYEDNVFVTLQKTAAIQSIVLFLTFSALMILVLRHSVFLPFKKLLKAAKEIKEGDYTVQINHGAKDEIGEFITAFNRMVKEVEKRESRISNDAELILEGRMRFEFAIQTIDAGIWDLNVETGEIITNDRLSTMLGYHPKEILPYISFGKNILHPEEADEIILNLKELLEGKTSLYRYEYRLLTKSGKWKWISSFVKEVARNDNGKPSRIIGLNIDIDDRKKDEVELAEFRKRLEEIIDQRTADLHSAQDELIGRAIESGRAQLSAMILHNIGNAMTPVSVQVDELRKDELGKISDYLEKCYHALQDNADHLTEYISTDAKGKEVFVFLGKLIKSLKDQKEEFKTVLDKISKAVNYISEIISLQQNYAAGKNENRQLTDVNMLLDDALKMQMSALEKRGIVIRKEMTPDPSLLIIDKNKLMQVIVNLIKNSYEAIDELNDDKREKAITVRSFKKDNTVGFEIADTGIGIEPGMIEIIPKFGQSGKGSSGFGLYYCKMFIEANKGKLAVNSPGKGKGSTVKVTFKMNDIGAKS